MMNVASFAFYNSYYLYFSERAAKRVCHQMDLLIYEWMMTMIVIFTLLI